MRQISCEHCPLRRKSLFRAFEDDELAFMEGFKAGELSIDRGSHLMIEGAPSPQIFTVLEGMGLRYKTLENGRRQVINFLLPGDLVGLQAGLLGEMKHSVQATSEMRLCVFNRSDLWALYRKQPSLALRCDVDRCGGRAFPWRDGGDAGPARCNTARGLGAAENLQPTF